MIGWAALQRDKQAFSWLPRPHGCTIQTAQLEKGGGGDRRRQMARPKRTVPIPREERWQKKAEPGAEESGEDAGNKEDGPSREAREDHGHPKPQLEDEPGKTQEELNEGALSAGISVPSNPQEEEDDIVVVESKVGEAIVCLSSDSESAEADSVQSIGDDGLVESARRTCRGINVTGWKKKRHGSTTPAAPSFDCTACGKEMFSAVEILEHPALLGVGICNDCYDFLFSSPFTKDTVDCAEEQCRWCGQGGRIVMCDKCDKAFCEACIVRNYGRKALAQILNNDDNNWSCFCCNPGLLCAHVTELEEFRKSVPPVIINFAVKRNGAASSVAGKWITRDASDKNQGTPSEGATIAELLALKEEERRKQNTWPTPTNLKVNSRAQKSRASRKRKAGTLEHTTSSEVKIRPTEVKQHEGNPKQAPSATTPARTFIRPHQMTKKRHEAAERRKRAEPVTYVPNDGPKHDNSNTQAKPQRLPDLDADQTLQSREFACSTIAQTVQSVDRAADAAVGNEVGKVISESDSTVANCSVNSFRAPEAAFDKTLRESLAEVLGSVQWVNRPLE